MDNEFKNRLRELRRNGNLSQEQLAERFGVSVQAVSKWETGQSYPDIGIICQIAGFFGVSIDFLLTGKAPCANSFAQDGALHINIDGSNGAGVSSPFKLDLTVLKDLSESREIIIQVNGSAEISGDIFGDVSADGDIAVKRNVFGRTTANGDIACGDINGSAAADGDIACSGINGSASANGDISCTNIGGSASAGGDITCGNIGGNADAGGNFFYK